MIGVALILGLMVSAPTLALTVTSAPLQVDGVVEAGQLGGSFGTLAAGHGGVFVREGPYIVEIVDVPARRLRRVAVAPRDSRPLAVNGRYLMVAAQNRVLAIDVETDGDDQVVATFDVPGGVVDAANELDRTWVLHEQGVGEISVANGPPEAETVIEIVGGLRVAWHDRPSQDWLWVVTQSEAIRYVPDPPGWIESKRIPIFHSPVAVAAAGDTLAVAGPESVGFYSIEAGVLEANLDMPRDVADLISADGRFVIGLASSSGDNFAAGPGEVLDIDATQPMSPSVVSTLTFPDGVTDLALWNTGLAVEPRLPIWVSASLAGAYHVEGRAAADELEVTNHLPPVGWIHAVAEGQALYTLAATTYEFTRSNRLVAVDALDPATAALRHVETPPDRSVRRVAATGNRVAVVSDTHLDMYTDTGSTLEHVGSLGLEDVGYDVAVDGDLAAVASAEGVSFVDIADPSTPVLVGQFSDASPMARIELEDAFAFLTTSGAGDASHVQVIEAVDPRSPLPLDRLPLTGPPVHSLDVAGSDVVIDDLMTFEFSAAVGLSPVGATDAVSTAYAVALDGTGLTVVVPEVLSDSPRAYEIRTGVIAPLPVFPWIAGITSVEGTANGVIAGTGLDGLMRLVRGELPPTPTPPEATSTPSTPDPGTITPTSTPEVTGTPPTATPTTGPGSVTATPEFRTRIYLPVVVSGPS